MENNKIKIIFMGTPEFSAIILKGLINSQYKPYLVITAPDKPVGRKQIITPPPVKLLAQKYEIPIVQPEKILNLKSEILNLKPDLVVVTAYGQILPKEILEIPKFGCLNVHPSLLPKWRGSSPIQYAISNGDKKTGVTIMSMDEKIDHGPILSQREIIIDEKETGKTLHGKLANLGTRLLLETIFQLERGLIKPEPQNEAEATYSKALTREDGKINWQKTAEEIERQIRAFELWPESFTFWEIIKEKLLRIKIFKAGVFKSPTGITFPIGKVLVVPPNKAGVQCGKDFLLIEKLQLEGQKPMESEDFLRGHPDFPHAILK